MSFLFLFCDAKSIYFITQTRANNPAIARLKVERIQRGELKSSLV